MQIDVQRILPVIVSILVIISVAVLRQYSKTFAAIAATMPINIPLGLWIVYAGEQGDAATTAANMADFSRLVTINMIPTIFFAMVAWLAFRSGWTLVPAILAGYAAWAVTLAISMVIRGWFGW
jgi:hypothetical protein